MPAAKIFRETFITLRLRLGCKAERMCLPQPRQPAAASIRARTLTVYYQGGVYDRAVARVNRESLWNIRRSL